MKFIKKYARRLKIINLEDITEETFSIRLLKNNYHKIIEKLRLEIKPQVYISPSLISYGEQPEGIIHHNKRKPIIILKDLDKDMLFNLAHELFHEYQYEHYKGNFIKRNIGEIENHEIEAQSFAIAYCIMVGEDCYNSNYKAYLPQNLGHIQIKDYKLKDKDERGIPVLYIEKIKIYKEKFNLKSRLDH